MLVEQQDIGFVADREAISVWANRSPETVRRTCPVHAYHRDGRALYVADQCLALLDEKEHRRARDGQPVAANASRTAR